MANVTCELRVEDCDCGGDVLETYNECVAALENEYERAFDAAASEGMTYDADCETTLTSFRVDAIGCRLESALYLSLRRELEQPYCKAFFGEGSLGDPCERIPVAGDNCARGLQCSDWGECVAAWRPPVLLDLGEPCGGEGTACTWPLRCLPVSEDSGETICGHLPALGEPCLIGVACAAPFACDTTTETCVVPPGVGEPCLVDASVPSGVGCAPGLLCDWRVVECAVGGAEGESCDSVGCRAGLYCERGSTDFCRPVLPEGTDCAGTSYGACGDLLCRTDTDGAERCLPETPLICR